MFGISKSEVSCFFMLFSSFWFTQITNYLSMLGKEDWRN